MRNERGGIRDLNYSTQHAQRCDQPLTLTRPFVTQSQRRPIRSLYSPSGSGLERFRARSCPARRAATAPINGSMLRETGPKAERVSDQHKSCPACRRASAFEESLRPILILSLWTDWVQE